MPIFWTSRAEADLDAIFHFSARSSEAYALLLVQRILNAVKRLEDFPWSGRVVPEFARDDVREVLPHPYRIVYRILNDEVHILIVQHGAKQLPDSVPG